MNDFYIVFFLTQVYYKIHVDNGNSILYYIVETINYVFIVEGILRYGRCPSIFFFPFSTYLQTVDTKNF